MHVEGVPNPNAIKFVLENGILTDQVYEFLTWQEAEVSPLAQKLLMIRYVDRVLINSNYVTIVKNIDKSPAWDQVLPELRMMIQQHLENNEPILYLDAEALKHDQSEDAIIALIQRILDQKIRPLAWEDGGDILFDSYENGVLNLEMHGSCHLCPYAGRTLKDGVERLMQHMVPEVQKVTAIANGVK